MRTPDRLPLDDPAEVRAYLERELIPWLREEFPVSPEPRVRFSRHAAMRRVDDLAWTWWWGRRAMIDLDETCLWHYRLAIEIMIHEWAHARTCTEGAEHGARWGREYRAAYSAWFDHDDEEDGMQSTTR